MKLFKVCVICLVLVLGGMLIVGCGNSKSDVTNAGLAWIQNASNGQAVPLKGEPVITFDDKKESATFEAILAQDGSKLTLLCVKQDGKWNVTDCASVPARALGSQ